jgi:hypothetical protein
MERNGGVLDSSYHDDLRVFAPGFQDSTRDESRVVVRS